MTVVVLHKYGQGNTVSLSSLSESEAWYVGSFDDVLFKM